MHSALHKHFTKAVEDEIQKELAAPAKGVPHMMIELHLK
jgi:hypothetical protein